MRTVPFATEQRRAHGNSTSEGGRTPFRETESAVPLSRGPAPASRAPGTILAQDRMSSLRKEQTMRRKKLFQEFALPAAVVLCYAYAAMMAFTRLGQVLETLA